MSGAPSDVRSDRLIKSIYGTLSRTGHWPEVLEEICQAFDASAVSFFEHNFGNRNGFIRYRCRHFDNATDQIYNTKMCGRNPWMRSDQPYRPETALLGTEILPNVELEKTAFYQDYLKPLGYLHRLCGVVARDGLEVQALALVRNRQMKPFRQSDKNRLQHILPHLHQAWDLRHHLDDDRSQREALLELIDYIPIACLLVNQGAQVRFLNKAAEQLLARRDGLLLTAGALTAGTSRESVRLRRMIAKVAAQGTPTSDDLGARIVISRISDRLPLLLTCYSVHRSEIDCRTIDRPGKSGALVALLVKDPDGNNLDNFDSFAAAYHLTAAEARLIGLLAAGRGLFQAAKQLGITNNTARTHMRHIYSKVGAHRQADLIRMLAKLGMSS